MAINGKSDLSKLDNLFLFVTEVGKKLGKKKIPVKVSRYSVGKTHTKQKSNPTVFYALEIEILTAANLLIGCLETRKQEIFSHSCQDQRF